MSIFGKSPILHELKKLEKEEEKLKKQAENYQGTKWKCWRRRFLQRYF